MATRVLGVDIGTSAVHLAEVELKNKQGTSGVLRGFASAEVPAGSVRGGVVIDPDGVARAIKQAMSAGRIKTKNAIVGIGSSSIAVREISLPEIALSEARRSLPIYGESVLPMPVDEAVLDFYPTRSELQDGRPLMFGLLVAVSKDAATRVLEATEQAGLKLKAIDLSAFAIFRCLGSSAHLGQVVAFIDIGARVTTVAVYQHGVPKQIRYLEGGTLTVIDSLVAATGIPAADALRAAHADVNTPVAPELAQALQQHMVTLLDGIRQTLVYFASTASSEPITDIVLTGGGSLMQGLPQALASRVRMRVTLGDPGTNVRPAGKSATYAMTVSRPLMAGAVGLALRELS